MRRRLDLGLLTALSAALLTGAAVWPAVTLASARGDASAAVYQATGYGPSYGSSGPSWSGNNYPGSGIGAWSGAAYLNATGWGPSGYGYPAGGYGWYSASGYSYPRSGSAGYLSYGGYPDSGALTSSAAAAPATQRVRLTIHDFYFLPAEISLPAGTQISWLNEGQTQHTITSVVSGLWDSGPIQPGTRWAAVFAAPGTYEYYCTIHPGQMRARLTITAS